MSDTPRVSPKPGGEGSAAGATAGSPTEATQTGCAAHAGAALGAACAMHLWTRDMQCCSSPAVRQWLYPAIASSRALQQQHGWTGACPAGLWSASARYRQEAAGKAGTKSAECISKAPNP